MRRLCLLKYSISCCVVVVLLPNRAVAENRPAELQKACDGGNLQDCKRLGDMYRRSHLEEADAKSAALYQKALPFYQKACDGGDAKRCGDLSTMYFDGLGVSKDLAKAVLLEKKACDGGDTGECLGLGDLYEGGVPGILPKDGAKAVALYQKACDDWYWVGCVKVKIHAR